MWIASASADQANVKNPQLMFWTTNNEKAPVALGQPGQYRRGLRPLPCSAQTDVIWDRGRYRERNRPRIADAEKPKNRRRETLPKTRHHQTASEFRLLRLNQRPEGNRQRLGRVLGATARTDGFGRYRIVTQRGSREVASVDFNSPVLMQERGHFVADGEEARPTVSIRPSRGQSTHRQ